MSSERIGLRFGKKDIDIISWLIMLKERDIEPSFIIKSLVKAYFLGEKVNGGTVKIRMYVTHMPISIAINEQPLNADLMKVKSSGIKLATFTKDIIRMYIRFGEKDLSPAFEELQKVNTKYKLNYLKNVFKVNDEISVDYDRENLKRVKVRRAKKIKKYNNESIDKSDPPNNKDVSLNDDDTIKKSRGEHLKKKNPLLSQI